MEFVTAALPWVFWIIGIAVFLLVVKMSLGIVVIKENEVGQIIKKFSFDGKKLPQGRVVALNGEPGYQAKVLAPGMHFWYWPWMYNIVKDGVVVIKPGKIGLIAAKDGAPQPKDRVVCKSVQCNMFQDAEAFLNNGGQKGKQGTVLTAGMYRINKALFDVFEAEVTKVSSDKVGMLTASDGRPLSDGLMAAPTVAGHSNFQDSDAFYELGGMRGLQEQILLAGQYNLNPWFVTVEEADLVLVPIGYVGVVVSFVGEDKADISGEEFTHGNIVPKGGKGVWAEPLYPGKHPINTRTMKVELVPTTNIVLNWATARTESHKLDEKLNTITVRSKDGFKFNLDVSQIINIGAKEAPYVISRVGSVTNLVNQVLEPIIGNYFRNSAQNYTVLDFLENRAARQHEAGAQITTAIKEYNVESVDTLIGDITPPEELMAPLTARKVAEEVKKTNTVQEEAQVTRQRLVAATALAEKQTELVNEEQNIEIARRKALAVSEAAEGEASAIRKRGQAEADIVAMKGTKEAEAVQAIGLAKAAAAKAGVEAMGDNFALVQIFQFLSEHNIKLVPDVVGGGDGEGGALMGMVMSLLAKAQGGVGLSK